MSTYKDTEIWFTNNNLNNLQFSLALPWTTNLTGNTQSGPERKLCEGISVINYIGTLLKQTVHLNQLKIQFI